MSRFDIRIRRRQFTEGRIEKHKNYQQLMQSHYHQSKRRTRGITVLVFLLIILTAIFLAFFCRGSIASQTEKLVNYNETELTVHQTQTYR